MVLVILCSIIVATVRFAVLPNIQHYQADIISRVSLLSGMDVAAGTIRGGWAGLRPYVEMEDVVFLEPASSTSALRPAGTAALRLPKLTAGLSWWALLVGQIRFDDVVLDGPELALNRNQDGFIYFAGRPLNQPKSADDDGQLLAFLVEQPGLSITHASLTWEDALAPGAALRFTDVGLSIKKNSGKHQIGFVANPPAALARKIEARADLELDLVDGRWNIKGTLYASAADASLTELRQHATVPEALQAGSGNLRAWIEIDNTAAQYPALTVAAPTPTSTSTAAQLVTTEAIPTPGPYNPFRAITADVYLTNARAQFDADLAPLNIAKLAGRIEYRAQEGGFTGGGKSLEIRTREGVVLPPADFSLTLQNQHDARLAKGELTGNNIDLKVMFALMEYFPVGKELRNFVSKYQPRGELKNTTISWNGKLDSESEKLAGYRLKGSFENFGLNTDGKNPGISNFSGTVEGDDKGGKYHIGSKMLAIDDPSVFRAPLKFDTFDSDGKWRVTPDAIEVDLTNVNFANSDLAAEFAGFYSRFRAGGARAAEEKGPGSIDIKGKFSRVKAVTVGDYLPNGIGQTRGYLEHALKDSVTGEMSAASFQVKGEVFEFPFHNGKGGNFSAQAQLKNVDFRYNDDWPIAAGINGEMRFENTKVGLVINSVKILNTNIKSATIDIADLNDRAGAIQVNLAADARAEEVTKFLRDSPLAMSVGGFTKVVEVEGLGKLSLGLTIPLVAVKDGIKVNGRYTLLRATAKPSIGTAISNLSGVIAFTERNVQTASIVGGTGIASGTSGVLQGLAYGNPVTISVTGGGEAGVLAEFSARAELSQLSDVLPFRLPQQVSGATDFKGKILAKATGTEVTIFSNLDGVSSSLPYPMAKRVAEVRPLRVQFVNAAQSTERIKVQLAGNALANPGVVQAAATAASVAESAAGGASGGANVGAAMPTADDPETRVDARFQRRFNAAGIPGSLLGGVATIGEGVADVPIPDGVWFAGRLKQLDLDAWRAAIQGFDNPRTVVSPIVAHRAAGLKTDVTQENKPEQQGEAKPDAKGDSITGFDLKLGGLLAYGRQFGAMALKGRHGGEDWRFVVESTEASGDFTWRPGAYNDQGLVRARLKNFVLVDEATVVVPIINEPSTPHEADFPALDIIAEKFTLKDRWMGRLELRATPLGSNWKIDQLTISNGHVKLDMDGMWLRNGGNSAVSNKSLNGLNERSMTKMNIKLDSSNLNALFAQFGFGDLLRGGTGQLEGKLAWPGHAYQMQLSNLSGDFKVSARNGQFAKIEPGAGKLLGLISLQSLPRRITLDFRDIFSQGFAFNTIGGDLKVKDGIMATENFEVIGPAAEVRMAGDVSLPTERVNLAVTVLPRLDESIAVGAGLATLNPIVGLAVYLGQKVLQNPVEKIFSYRYAVSGTWDNPQVSKLDRNGVAEKPPATVVGPSALPGSIETPSFVTAPANVPIPLSLEQSAPPTPTPSKTTPKKTG